MSAEDRAIGALSGLACGDAVGTTLEFQRPGSFTPIDDMVGGGPFRLEPGQWTDDTSMALCLAESILDTGGLDPTDQLRRYLLWRDHGYLSSTGRSHAARRPVDACRVLGAMVAALVAGTPADEVLAPGFWRWGDLHPAVESVARGSWRDKVPPVIRGTGYCVDALEAALWAVAGAQDYREAVLRAANLGDDADTTAAIASQLAGARWGSSWIPGRWREQLTASDRIESLARALFIAGGGEVVEQAAAARGLVLDQVRFPIPDNGVVEDDRYDDVVDLIADGQRAGVVYVHCWGGVGRTGTVVGSVLAAAGADYAEVTRRLGDLRAGTRKEHRACPENQRQLDVLARRCRSGRSR